MSEDEQVKLTVGELRGWLDGHNVPDDAEVWAEYRQDNGYDDRDETPIPTVTFEATSNGHARLIFHLD